MSSPVTQTIAERDLLICIRSQSLRRLAIVQTDTGWYQLRARVSFATDELVLVNMRGKVREWASLDRLANHIRRKYGSPSCLAIDLGQATDS